MLAEVGCVGPNGTDSEQVTVNIPSSGLEPDNGASLKTDDEEDETCVKVMWAISKNIHIYASYEDLTPVTYLMMKKMERILR